MTHWRLLGVGLVGAVAITGLVPRAAARTYTIDSSRSRATIEVGKSGALGSRLSNYFSWHAGRGSSCRIVHTGWRTRPMFVATIAVTEFFEAASLEEFLIARIHPAENR